MGSFEAFFVALAVATIAGLVGLRVHKPMQFRVWVIPTQYILTSALMATVVYDIACTHVAQKFEQAHRTHIAAIADRIRDISSAETIAEVHHRLPKLIDTTYDVTALPGGTGVAPWVWLSILAPLVVAIVLSMIRVWHNPETDRAAAPEPGKEEDGGDR